MALVRRVGPGRLAVLERIVAGLGGGYALAAAAAWCLAEVLPGPRVEAATAASLYAYLLFVAAALWSFVPRRGRTVWIGIGGAIAGCLAIGWGAAA